MKTHIIRLEPHDDVNSARDKITWGKSARILLVWPRRARILTHKIELALLQRCAIAQGAQLGFVTRDGQIRAYARELGLPVFANVTEAQRRRWRIRRRKPDFSEHWEGPAPDLRALQAEVRASAGWKLENIWIRSTAFTLGVLAVLVLAAFLLPSAHVSLALKEMRQTVRLQILAGQQIQKVNFSAGEVPSALHQMAVEGSDSLPTTGSMLYPNQRASGSVQFTNLTGQPVDIPRGTVVRTAGEPPVRFATTLEVQLKGGIGQTVEAPVQALEAGASGNLPAQSLQAIEGPLGLNVTVNNPNPTQGGSDLPSPAPSAADRANLRQRMVEKLSEQALENLQAGLSDGDLLVPGSLSVQKVMSEVYDPPQDAPADRLSLTLRLEVGALVISGQDLHALAQAVMDADKPSGYHPANDRIDFHPDGNSIQIGGNYQLGLVAERTLLPDIHEEQLAGRILGLKPAEAAHRLQTELPLAGAPAVILNPVWWPRLPFLPFRISFASQ